jgi:hypothetical protein
VLVDLDFEALLLEGVLTFLFLVLDLVLVVLGVLLRCELVLGVETLVVVFLLFTEGELVVLVLVLVRFPLLDVLFPIVDLVRVLVEFVLTDEGVLEVLVAVLVRVLVVLLLATEFLL